MEPVPGDVLARLPIEEGLALCEQISLIGKRSDLVATLKRALFTGGRWRIRPETRPAVTRYFADLRLAERDRWGFALTDRGLVARAFVLGRLGLRLEKSDDGPLRSSRL